MSSHRTEGSRRAVRRAARPRRSGRARALVALGAVAVLATGMSVKGTFAFWTDSATLQTGTFASGTLDITLDGQLVGPNGPGNPGVYTPPTLNMSNMVPGESVAYSFPVRNNGTTPLTYTVTGTGTGPLAVQNGMQYSVTFGPLGTVPAANPGTPAANNRAGSCGGTAATDTNTTLLQGTPVGFGGVNRPLAVGAGEQVCIVARFNSNAPNTLQGQNSPANPTNASFLFNATQVGTPPA